MPVVLHTSEVPLLKFKFAVQSSRSLSPRAIHIIAAKFETAVAAAREEAKKHQADLTFSGVEVE